MMKKETAKQRRERKEQKRIEKSAAKTARRKSFREWQTQQREFSKFLNRPYEEVSKMTETALLVEVTALHGIAYERYQALLAQGTPNVATVKYETEFGGLNPAENNINANRAVAAKLRAWLKRKDANLKRAKRQQEKTLKWARKHGYTGDADGLKELFEYMVAYSELHGGQYKYNLFPAVYSAIVDAGGSMQDVFAEYDKRERAAYERDMSNTRFGGAPLEMRGGVRAPNPSELLVSYQKSLSTPGGTGRAKKTKSKRRKRK